MKKLLIVTFVMAFVLGSMGLAQASFSGWVSFVLPAFQNVDTTTGWSLTDNTNNLNYSSFNILGGAGTVTGYLGQNLRNLSHRGTRGIGIQGGENDEIDYRTLQERLVITFTEAQKLDYLEVRSLFDPEGNAPEVANIDYYLNNVLVGSSDIAGTLSGGNGLEYVMPHLLVDRIVFQVDNQTQFSDFAVSKLGFLVPEPATMALLGMGVLGLFGLRRKKA